MTARLSPAPASPGMRPWRQRWLALAALLAAAAVLLLAAPQRRSLGGALLRAVLPGHAPDATTLCTMSQLDGFVDGDVRWDSWARLPARAGKLPPWRPPWLSMQRRCTLRRFSPQQARQCLAGRPLVMIGDSVTRWVQAGGQQGQQGGSCKGAVAAPLRLSVHGGLSSNPRAHAPADRWIGPHELDALPQVPVPQPALLPGVR